MNERVQLQLHQTRAPVTWQPEQPFTREMLLLNQRIDALLLSQGDEWAGRVIQFVATGQEDGSTEIANHYARVSTSMLDKSVLLLGRNLIFERRGHGTTFATKPPAVQIWSELSSSAFETALTTANGSGGSLTILSLDVELAYRAAAGRRKEFEKLMNRFRACFDLVIVDSPNLGTQVAALGLSPLADGVVVIADDETSRDQAVQLREHVESVGGNVLGMVFNRRKPDLPVWLEKLFA